MRNVARAILLIFLAFICVHAQAGLQVDKASIGGTVTNAATGKPEAGVWVIAETKLAVPYRKIVVTDDQGRFLAPDLPTASYDVWVRGYGLKDSAKTKAERGAQVKLQVNAATPQEAAKIDRNNVEGTEAAAQKAWMRVDTKTGKVIPTSGYATGVNPVDGTIWVPVPAVDGPQNKIYMLDPKTQKYTDYPLPLPGRLAHGVDFSTDGNVWFSAGSGHLGRVDRRTGKFTYWELPGAKFAGTGKETGSTEYPYFMWVDQFDTLGMGKDTVIVTGTTSDEGRGIWTSYNSYLPKFSETKLGYLNHIQLRPNPLAN